MKINLCYILASVIFIKNKNMVHEKLDFSLIRVH